MRGGDKGTKKIHLVRKPLLVALHLQCCFVVVVLCIVLRLTEMRYVLNVVQKETKLRTALFWVINYQVVVIHYRRFGTNY